MTHVDVLFLKVLKASIENAKYDKLQINEDEWRELIVRAEQQELLPLCASWRHFPQHWKGNRRVLQEDSQKQRARKE